MDNAFFEAFARNRGLLSEDDQKLLHNSRVAVAGAGGVGGIHLLTLARLGIGKFTLADPDIFERVNINRQFGAMESTIGRNKAEVIGQMIMDINPHAEVKILTEGVNHGNLDYFLEGVQIYLDGIDFFEIDIRRLVFNTCRNKGIYALTAAPLGFGATLQTFSPDGMGFDQYFGIDDSTGEFEKIAAFAVGLAPNSYHIRYMDFSRVSFKDKTGPAVSPACTLAASFIATEVVKIITGKGKVRPVPDYVQLDMMLGKWKRGRVFWGGGNPLQRLKRKLVLKKLLTHT